MTSHPSSATFLSRPLPFASCLSPYPPGHAESQDVEKEKIKEHIVNVMLASPPKVQAQISEALSIISSHDFPARWPSLLPELVSRLSASSSDYPLLLGVLQTANSIFKRFRHQFKTEQLFMELKQCLDSWVAPSLALFLAARTLQAKIKTATMR